MSDVRCCLYRLSARRALIQHVRLSSGLHCITPQDVQAALDRLKQFVISNGESTEETFQGPRGNLDTALKMFSGTYAADNCGAGAARRDSTGRIINATERPVLQPVTNGEVKEMEQDVIIFDLLCYRQSPTKVRSAHDASHVKHEAIQRLLVFGMHGSRGR